MAEVKYKDIKNYISELKDKPFERVYLIYGEDFLYKTIFNNILDTILPGSEKNFNYEPFDDAVVNIPEVIEKLNTYSFMSGTRVITLQDSQIFHSKQDESSILNKSKEFFDKYDLKNASKYFVSVLSLLNLSYDDVKKENRNDYLKSDISKQDEGLWIDKIVEYCIHENKSIPSSEDDAKILLEAIENGFAEGCHLIITAEAVDKRKLLYKTIHKNGVIIDCSVPKGETKADRNIKDEILRERMDIILKKNNKSLSPDAFNTLCNITGFDLRSFTGNLEKLINYIGEKKKIAINDIHSVLKRTKKDPIFELTNAIASRNLQDALFYTNSLLSDNFHPLQLLAAITNQVRKLILFRGYLDSPLGKNWFPGCPYNQFTQNVMDSIIEYDNIVKKNHVVWDEILVADEKKSVKNKNKKLDTDLLIAKNPGNAYPIYLLLKKAEKFTMDELYKAYKHIFDSDLILKSAGQNPRMVIENTIIRICRKG